MTKSLKIPHFYLMEEIDITEIVKSIILVRNEKKFYKRLKFEY